MPAPCSPHLAALDIERLKNRLIPPPPAKLADDGGRAREHESVPPKLQPRMNPDTKRGRPDSFPWYESSPIIDRL
jgi:hypothetical protein